MRIGVLTTSFPRDEDDDAGIFVKRLLEALSFEGEEGVVIVPYDSQEQPQETIGNFTVHRYSYRPRSIPGIAFGAGILPNIRSNPLLLLEIPFLLFGMFFAAYFKRKEFDIVHCNWISSAFGGFLLYCTTKKPYVVTLRGEDIKLLSIPVISPLCKLILSKARCLTTISDEFKERLLTLNVGTKESIQVIPNGVSVSSVSKQDARTFLRKYTIPPNVPFLLFVGTIVPRKNIASLIQLLEQSLLQNFHLVLCGRTDDVKYLTKIKEEISQKGLTQRVHLVGVVSPRDISNFYHAADVYVSASTFEGKPNAVLEALASGLPLCLSDIPQHKQFLQGREGVITLFNETSYNTAAQFILQLLNDPSRYEEASKKAKLSVSELLWNRAAKQYMVAFGH